MKSVLVDEAKKVCEVNKRTNVSKKDNEWRNFEVRKVVSEEKKVWLDLLSAKANHSAKKGHLLYADDQAILAMSVYGLQDIYDTISTENQVNRSLSSAEKDAILKKFVNELEDWKEKQEDLYKCQVF
ncbi:hypothetical protein EVAR_68332_1 [Eumeta japonica]|uniref:Uncharacterized protein n=1 Tax=Eumeta variegata TaxID=151549 RepID=A0A4C2ABN8_EUMVA|nr:hypothetical protein EVAR_68332_1 [Eumeta japonica]